jgi:hypothetical protein
MSVSVEKGFPPLTGAPALVSIGVGGPTVNQAVNVEAKGGTPEGNTDLANWIGR